MHHLKASNWQFKSQSALPFSNFVFQVYIIANVPCCRCEFPMSSGFRDSLKLGFPYLHCSVPVYSNIFVMAEQNLMKISNYIGVKSPVDFKFGVRIDVGDPQPRQPLRHSVLIVLCTCKVRPIFFSSFPWSYL